MAGPTEDSRDGTAGRAVEALLQFHGKNEERRVKPRCQVIVAKTVSEMPGNF